MAEDVEGASIAETAKRGALSREAVPCKSELVPESERATPYNFMDQSGEESIQPSPGRACRRALDRGLAARYSNGRR